MKPKLIVMSHGNMAEEVLNSSKMIIGEIEGVKSICMMQEDGFEVTQNKLKSALSEYSDDESVLIMVDLLGGTPSNVALQERCNRVEVIAGLNLGLVIEYAMSSEANLHELVSYLVDMGRSSIQGLGSIVEDLDDEVECD